jgi:MoaA/NifB/PqqE/SkfB family radical SAM enzyme
MRGRVFMKTKVDNLQLKYASTEITYQDDKFIIPSDIAKALGITNGSKLKFVIKEDSIEILPDIHSLSRVYIEPTAKCNLMCQTCIRHTWNEPMGEMDINVFDKIIEQLKSFESVKSIMFGGFGEPTFHKDILYMIEKAKSLNIKVEMTTNGTLLDENMLKSLLECKLDTLWVSFDGTSQESFEDIRSGAKFSKLVDNLKYLKEVSKRGKYPLEIGIAFVVMKRNVNDLKNIKKLARTIGAKYISLSNVLPYDRKMQDEVLYNKTLGEDVGSLSYNDILINLPRMDVNDTTKEALYEIARNNSTLIASNGNSFEKKTCRFIKERCTFIRWDGSVSSCMGLLHSYTTYLHNSERRIEAYTLGNINESSIGEIWNSNEYTEFRDKVYEFNFSPCHMCGGCEYFESNKEDCFGNKFPACGACLWAQGVIQCP